MTPWLPIAVTIVLTLVPAAVIWRRTRNGMLSVSTGLLVLALASLALGTIATVAFFWGAALLLAALIGFAAARSG
jgi:hypothetical protein